MKVSAGKQHHLLQFHTHLHLYPPTAVFGLLPHSPICLGFPYSLFYTYLFWFPSPLCSCFYPTSAPGGGKETVRDRHFWGNIARAEADAGCNTEADSTPHLLLAMLRNPSKFIFIHIPAFTVLSHMTTRCSDIGEVLLF